MNERHKVIPAAFVFVQEGQNVLLQRRLNTGFRDGEYDASGSGHIEIGETPPEAAVRELEEETGLVADQDSLELFHIISNDFEESDRSYIYFFFRIGRAACSGSVEIKEPEKCDDMDMFPLSELPVVVPHVAMALEYLRDDGVTFSSIPK
jgi:8-oxo-dGTP diphosphatase